VARSEIKPAYLISGDDEAKIDAALARLRDRAEREGGPGALESFGAPDGQGAPDIEALVAAMSTMSLTASRRYLLADRLERLDAPRISALADALPSRPPDVTIVLIERRGGASGRPSRARSRALGELTNGIESAGGEVISYSAPKARDLPNRLVAMARRKGLELAPEAARMLVDRMGESTLRLSNELERLALWAGAEGRVSLADLEDMVADTSEEAAWTVSDALIARDRRGAMRGSERLLTQGQSVTPIVYQAAKRLREAHAALLDIEAGVAQREVESSLPMHPYAAKLLVRRLRGRSPAEIRVATCAVADLEWWSRGGSDYPDDVALSLTVRRATGAGAGED